MQVALLTKVWYVRGAGEAGGGDGGGIGGDDGGGGVGGGGDTENTDWDAVGRGNPRGRVGSAEDIAGLAIFLSSRACGFTVGDIVTCDGGVVVS